ncbi:MAG: hypothetical protein K8I30_18610 [Anaerolineae bacterium]|nr:hypothetical protein [Anaerolineae bacterium]
MSVNPNTKMPAPMPAQVRIPRWEYVTLAYNYSYGSTTYEVNGEKEGSLKNKPLFETLNLFGQHGWELVGSTGTDGKVFLLKRPLVKLTDHQDGGHGN